MQLLGLRAKETHDERAHGRTDGCRGHDGLLRETKTPEMDRGVREEPRLISSIDWFKGKITGTSHFSWENLWFPVDCPLRQTIDYEKNRCR